MSLKRIDGEHEEEKYLQCISLADGPGGACEGTLFAVGTNDSSQHIITCDNCGEEYELGYAIEVLNKEEGA